MGHLLWTLGNMDVESGSKRGSEKQSRKKQDKSDSDVEAGGHPMQPVSYRDDGRTSLRDAPSLKRQAPALVSHYEMPRVYLRTVFMKVGQIETIKELYEADLFIQARWREPELDYSVRKSTSSEVDWDNYWNPELVVQNLIKESKRKVWKSVEYSPAGEAFVLEKRRISGEFSETMELQSFPFDTQSLSVTITSEDKDLEFLEDNTLPSRINHANFVDKQEWSVWDIVEFAQGGPGGEVGDLEPEQPTVSFRIYTSRMSGFSVWNILAVMGIILSLALCPFTVDRWNPGSRLQLSFTLVLTTVAFKFVANQSLPRISYLTILDKYILTSMLLMHLCTAYHASIGLVDEVSDVGDLIDMVCFIVVGSIFLIFQIIFYIAVKTRISNERKGLKLLGRQYQGKVGRLAQQASSGGQERKGRGSRRGISPYN